VWRSRWCQQRVRIPSPSLEMRRTPYDPLISTSPPSLPSSDESDVDVTDDMPDWLVAVRCGALEPGNQRVWIAVHSACCRVNRLSCDAVGINS
jgi:hypothetical protein